MLTNIASVKVASITFFYLSNMLIEAYREHQNFYMDK